MDGGAKSFTIEFHLADHAFLGSICCLGFVLDGSAWSSGAAGSTGPAATAGSPCARAAHAAATGPDGTIYATSTGKYLPIGEALMKEMLSDFVGDPGEFLER